MAASGALAASCSLGFSEDRLARVEDDATTSQATSATGSGGAAQGSSVSTSSTSSGSGGSGTTSASSSGGGDPGAGGTGGTGGGTGGAGGSSPLRDWPDSATAFCSDGVAPVSCPPNDAVLATQDGAVIDPEPLYEIGKGVGGTVLDVITGLTWERSPDAVEREWQAASDHCEALDLEGSGWRLPTLRELSSLWDAGRETLPRIDEKAFPGTGIRYWTSTPTIARTHAIVRFDPNARVDTEVATTAVASVRCVQAPPREAPTLLQEEEVIVDAMTGLMWERRPSNDPQTWSGALEECADLEKAGFDDWRLATVKELATIIVPSTSPALPEVFRVWNATSRWTSTANPANAAQAFVFVVESATTPGRSTANDVTLSTNRAAACVRDLP